MIKLALIALAISAVHLEQFDPEDAKNVCAAYSSNPDDKYAEKEGSEVIYYTSNNLNDIKQKRHFIAYHGRCGHIYCPDEYACICNKENVYHNNCHMRSLGVLRGYACDCPPKDSENIIKNSSAKSHRAIKDYNKAQKETRDTDQ